MAGERLHNALSENLLTILGHDDEHGKLVANLIEPSLFEGDYRIFAERFIAYWKQHGKAPKYHVADLVADILEDPQNRKAGTFRRIIASMIELSEHINTTYVLDQLTIFMRVQKMKSVILQSAERLNSQQELAVPEIEQMFHDILRTREFAFDPGIKLSEIDRVLAFMEGWETEFTTGIGPLDQRGIVPRRGSAWLLLAPTGIGKTWGVIHLGKRALLQRKRVLHLSLEMSAEQVFQRYYQSLFSIPKREVESVDVTTLVRKGDDAEFKNFSTVNVEPEFYFASPTIKDELEAHVGWFGTKFENLRIKRFAPRSLTIGGMIAFLDNLETTEGFIPDLLICDSPYLMKIDPRNWRIELGRAYEEFRGIGVERNIAAVATHQISRSGAKQARAKATHVAEDWSIIQTSDYVVTLTATEGERAHGLARLYVDKARDEEDKFGVLLTQNYVIGQFALESMRLPREYWDKLKAKGWSRADDDEEDDNAE